MGKAQSQSHYRGQWPQSGDRTEQDAPLRRQTQETAQPGPQPFAGNTELLEVGRIVAAQGLRGELRVNPLSDFPERFTRPGPRWLRNRQGGLQTTRLLNGRSLPGRELFVIRLEGVNDRTAAEALVGQELLVPAADRPRLEPGEFHLLDLVGLAVHRLDEAGNRGELIGHVRDLLHAGNDLLEVQLHGSDRTLWIPFVQAIAPRVDLANGWIGITPPPGLLELADAPQAETEA
jgi:16S rRNA processing protein RimM